MQKFIAIGNLTKDPMNGATSDGTSYCNFTIAVTRSYKDSNGEKQADFFNCIAWRGLADTIGKYCVKGTKVCIVGQLQNRSYDDKDGVRRTATEVIVENVEFLSPKTKSETTQTSTETAAPKSRRVGTKGQMELTPVDDETLPF